MDQLSVVLYEVLETLYDSRVERGQSDLSFARCYLFYSQIFLLLEQRVE